MLYNMFKRNNVPSLRVFHTMKKSNWELIMGERVIADENGSCGRPR